MTVYFDLWQCVNYIQTFPRPWTVTRFIYTLLKHLSGSVDSISKGDICAVSDVYTSVFVCLFVCLFVCSCEVL